MTDEDERVRKPGERRQDPGDQRDKRDAKHFLVERAVFKGVYVINLLHTTKHTNLPPRI